MGTMPPNDYYLDWSDIAFGSKKPLRELRATFIAAPRTLSAFRLKQLIKRYLPQGNVVLGISKEPHVLGLERQPQFAMLAVTPPLARLIEKVNAASPKYKLYVLNYSQRDTVYVIEEAGFKRAVLVNGSWYTAFHMRPEYYALVQKSIPYEMVSPFAGEEEARAFPSSVALPALPTSGMFDETDMFTLLEAVARHSYDYAGFQTAVAIGRKKSVSYELMLTTHNRVLPYETYAMHYGGARERNFSPMNDLNHYDTIHAEMLAIIYAQQECLDLNGTTLFINLLPCPHCARALSLTGIMEFVYTQDHSAGYAVRLLESLGKKVRRVIPPAKPAE